MIDRIRLFIHAAFLLFRLIGLGSLLMAGLVMAQVNPSPTTPITESTTPPTEPPRAVLPPPAAVPPMESTDAPTPPVERTPKRPIPFAEESPNVVPISPVDDFPNGLPDEAALDRDTNDNNIDNHLLARIRQRGELRVGLSTFIPWVMNSQSGELIGFEVDVARRLADDLGVAVRFQLSAWDAILVKLLNDEFDIIISGMSVTPQRALLVNFSQMYGHSHVMLLAHRQKAVALKTRADFNQPTVTLAVQANTTNAVWAARLFPNAVMQYVDRETTLFTALHSGEVHGIIASTPRPQFELLRYPDQFFFPENAQLGKTGEAFAVRQGEPDFINFLDNWIRFYEQDGWLAERRHYWFETFEWVDQL